MEAILEGVNPFSASRAELHFWQHYGFRRDRMKDLFTTLSVGCRYGGEDHAKLLRASVTLFRRNNMKSVRILRDAKLESYSIYNGLLNLYNGYKESLSFAKDGAGSKAERMMSRDLGLHSPHVNMQCSICSLLPAPGSKDAPTWLVNYRKATNGRDGEL